MLSLLFRPAHILVVICVPIRYRQQALRATHPAMLPSPGFCRSWGRNANLEMSAPARDACIVCDRAPFLTPVPLTSGTPQF